jgi:solute carrier family 25 thiamine pyrophosphate transporter 19
MNLPEAVLARWQRRQVREGRTNADTSDLCRSEIEKLRGQRPSIDRDASLALWLEHTSRNSGGRRDALEEAASLLTRAAAIAERRDQYDGLDDLRRWRRRVCYLRDCATAPAPEPAATEAVPRLKNDASAAAVAAFLARGEPVVVEGGADACVKDGKAWTPAALAASLGAKSAPLKAADAPSSKESWAGLGTKGQLPLGAFLERPDEGLYLHDWSLPRNAPEALLDELRTPRWLRGDLLRRCGGDDVPYAGAWPSLFVGAPGTRSACHVDSGSLHFAMALVHGGAKKWRVWRREDAAFLFPRFAVSADDVLFDAARAGAAQPRWVVCQKPGDLVFVPSDCPHAVDNDGITVGLATNFVDGSNVDAVAASLADTGDAASLRLRQRLLALADGGDDVPAKRARRV